MQVCAGPQSCDGGQPPQVPPQPSSPQVFPVQSDWQLVVAPPSALDLELSATAAPESPPNPPSCELGPSPVDESTDGSPDSDVTGASWPPPSRTLPLLCKLSELLQAAASTETTHDAQQTEGTLMQLLQCCEWETHVS
jgi:hypothetical protein